MCSCLTSVAASLMFYKRVEVQRSVSVKWFRQDQGCEWSFGEL